MKKTIRFVTIFLLIIATATIISVASAASLMPSDYIPHFEVVRTDTFEGLAPPSNSNTNSDYIYKQTGLFYVDGNAATITSGAGNAINGQRSLIWTPNVSEEEGWSLYGYNLGISAPKMINTIGGFLLRIELKIRLTNSERFYVQAQDITGTVLQEAVIDGEYNRLSKAQYPDIRDDGRETTVTVSTFGSGTSKYAKIIFTYRGPVIKAPCYQFLMKGTAGGASPVAIIDDVIVYREAMPNMTYRNYETDVVEGFENASIAGGVLSNSMFSFENATNLNTSTSSIISGTSAIKDNHSLSLYSVTRNSDSRVKSETFELKAGTYKLYFRMRVFNMSSAGIYVKKASDNSVVYDYIYNFSAGTRKVDGESVATPLFDQSNMVYHTNGNNAYYCEFLIPEDTIVYLELYFNHATNGYAIYDDINILKQFAPNYQNGPEPVLPQAPSGRVEADYDSSLDVGVIN